MVYPNSNSCNNMLDLLPLPGLVPVALKLAPSRRASGEPQAGFATALDGAKKALENIQTVQSAKIDHATRVATVVLDLGVATAMGKDRDQAVADIITALAAAGVDAKKTAYIATPHTFAMPQTFDKSEWLIFAAVGAATTATAYAYLHSRIPFIPSIV